jgi:iron complex outermembrane recepter protein
MKKRSVTLLLLLQLSVSAFAQEQTQTEDLYELSLEELMNVPINSASKRDETLFDAPLSSYTITRSEIEKSGATSIMEALRLAPGMIVREQTNGNYDIHIRGFDNLLQYNEDFAKINSTTLVMINDRPVFNNNLGGTFWESLPIDLNDVERIEIVRGPSAPLFGPNAVTGVINIITRRFEDKLSVTSSVQAGAPSMQLRNLSIGSKINDKFSVGASVNYQKRNRWETDYYSIANDNFDFTVNPNNYPNQDVSMNKYGVNAFVGFKANDNISVDATLSTQEAEAQKAFSGTTSTVLTTNFIRYQSVNLQSKIYGATVRASHLTGRDNLNFNSAPSRYNQSVTELLGEYEIKLTENLQVVPGISYQQANFDDAEFVQDGTTFLNGKEVEVTTSSAFLRADFRPIKNLRLIAAGRYDKFSSPDDGYLAYEFATTYKLDDSNILRAAVTRSNSGSFGANNFIDLSVVVPNGGGPGININYIRRGNTNLELFTVKMIELGYRSQLSKSLQVDVDLFAQEASNLNGLVLKGPDGTFTNGLPNVIEEFSNIVTEAIQIGSSIAINFVPNDKIQVKPFVTVQKTRLENAYSEFNNQTATFSNKDHENTPSIYGGYYFNIRATEKLNINSSAYFFGAHRQYDKADLDDNSAAGDIKGKFLMNLKVSYAISNKFSVFVNGRNILVSDSREFYGTDMIGATFLAGLSVNFKK